MSETWVKADRVPVFIDLMALEVTWMSLSQLHQPWELSNNKVSDMHTGQRLFPPGKEMRAEIWRMVRNLCRNQCRVVGLLGRQKVPEMVWVRKHWMGLFHGRQLMLTFRTKGRSQSLKWQLAMTFIIFQTCRRTDGRPSRELEVFLKGLWSHQGKLCGSLGVGGTQWGWDAVREGSRAEEWKDRSGSQWGRQKISSEQMFCFLKLDDGGAVTWLGFLRVL